MIVRKLTLEIIIGITIFIIIFIMINEYELRHFKVTEYNLVADKDIGTDKSFIMLSDLHDSKYGKNNKRLLDAINAIECDAVIIAGDMITGKKESDWSSTEEFLRELAKIKTIYYVNGNHEYRTREFPEDYGYKYEEYKEKLENSGIVFLENSSVLIDNVRVYGLEIDNKYYKKFKKNNVEPEEINGWIGKNKKEEYSILVAHNPRYIKDYESWEPDLILSGHFHGGTVRIPWIGGVLSPQYDLFPKYSGGLYRLESGYAIVSKGIGTHSVRIRIFNRPEIIKIKLQNKS